MSDDSPLAPIPASARAPLAAPSGAEPSEEAQFGAVQVAQRALRGRYAWLVLLVVMGALLGGAVGDRLYAPTYRSEGLLRIAYALPPVMPRPAGESGPVSIFEAFMRAQRLVITSRRTVDEAMKTQVWQETMATRPGIGPEQFANSLVVEYPGGTEYLRILYADRDPAVAAAAVSAVIEAYTDIFNNHGNRFERQRLQVLEERHKELAGQVAAMQQQLDVAVGLNGTIDLGPRFDALAKHVLALEGQLAEVRLALAMRKGQGAGGQPRPMVLSPAEIAQVDPVMREYMQRQARLTDLLSEMSTRFGPNHSQVTEVRKALEVAKQRVETYARDYRDTVGSVVHGPVAGAEARGAMMMRSAEDLQAEESAIAQLYDQAHQEMVTTGVKRAELDTLKAKYDKARADLAEVAQRQEQLRVESTLGSRLSVVSTPDTPVLPLRDLRPFTTAAGAGVGAAVPALLLVLLGLVGRRVRYADEAGNSATVPLLGVLPGLPEHLRDQEQAAEAAQCIHHVRVMLQNSRPAGASTVYAITSCAPGSGKTSLTMALGLSFQASGCRTLVIDADLQGRRLTAGLEAEDQPGLQEAMLAGDVRPFIRRSAAGVSYLSVGKVDTAAAWSISSRALRRLLEQLRKEYEVVLIDTGPVLGCVAASVAAPEADGVLFVMARGEHRPAVERSLRHLEALRAKLAGFIFNRAQRVDFYRSAYGSVRRPASARSDDTRQAVPDVDSAPLFGPLVRSVAMFLPTTMEGRS